MNVNLSPKLSFLFVFLLAFCVPMAFAGSTEYLTAGGDFDNSYIASNIFKAGNSSTVTEVSAPSSFNGSFTEPLFFDYDNDGIIEVFVQRSNGIHVLPGNNPGTPEASISLGNLVSQPAACDLDADGFKDYVGVFRQAGNTYDTLVAFTGETGSPSIIAQRNVSGTNTDTQLRCTNFYGFTHSSSAPGFDTANYVMFVNSTKHLHIFKQSGTGFTGNTQTPTGIIDVDPTGIDSAVTSEAMGGFTPFTYGSMDLFIQDFFNSGAGTTAIFSSGDYLYGYTSEGHEFAFDYSSVLTARYNQTSPNKQISYTGGLTNNNIAVSFGGDTGGSPSFYLDTQTLFFGSLIDGSGITGFDLYISRNQTTIDANPSSTNFVTGNTYDFTGDGRRDFIATIYSPTSSKSCPFVHVYDLSKGFIENTTFYVSDNSAPNIGESCHFLQGVPFSSPKSVFVEAQASNGLESNDNDKRLDLITGTIGGSGLTLELSLHEFADKTSDADTLLSKTSAEISLGTEDYYFSPVLGDFDSNGFMDYLISTPFYTTFLFTESDVVGQAILEVPFEVSLNDTGSEGLQTVQEVTGLFDPEPFLSIFKYAVACDVTDNVIFNELFTSGYNFTERNQQILFKNASGFFNENDVDTQSFTSFDGFTLTTASGFTEFNLIKTSDSPSSVDVSFEFVFETSESEYAFDLLLVSEDEVPFDYLRVIKNGSTVNVTQGSDNTLLGSGSVSGDKVTLEVDYKLVEQNPIEDSLYDREIVVNDVTINDTQTTLAFSGDEINKVHIFTDSTGTSKIASYGLVTRKDTTPEFLRFNNGLSETTLGATVEAPGAGTLPGDGFSITTNFNEAFYSTCSYPEPGSYKQRHYLDIPFTADDYSNFRELDVVVSETGIVSEGEPTFSDDDLVNTIEGVIQEDFLSLFGLSLSPSFKFILAIVGTLFLVFISISVVNNAMGSPDTVGTVSLFGGAGGFLFGLVLFTLFGWYPIWVALILAIIATGMTIFATRRVVLGG